MDWQTGHFGLLRELYFVPTHWRKRASSCSFGWTRSCWSTGWWLWTC